MSSKRKVLRMGSKSSSVSTAPPVMFFTLRVNDLKRPPTRPGLPSAAFFSSSWSDPEDKDSTSSSAFAHCSSSSESPKNVAFCASNAASLSPVCTTFFEKSSSSASFLFTLPSPSQWRSCFPFFASTAGGSSFFLSFPAPFFLPRSFARASVNLSFASSSSPSESSSPLPPPVAPDWPLVFADVAAPFVASTAFRLPWLPWPLFAASASLSTFRRTSMNAASKSTCLMLRPFPKPPAT
mmetsp:Transcript_28302/g.85313  ORF Transcript_28302/g.85313 Transcript_28302/m.85313 type:complete len:238 (+) Transcript_28302:920-1633(+)